MSWLRVSLATLVIVKHISNSLKRYHVVYVIIISVVGNAATLNHIPSQHLRGIIIIPPKRQSSLKTRKDMPCNVSNRPKLNQPKNAMRTNAASYPDSPSCYRTMRLTMRNPMRPAIEVSTGRGIAPPVGTGGVEDVSFGGGTRSSVVVKIPRWSRLASDPSRSLHGLLTWCCIWIPRLRG